MKDHPAATPETPAAEPLDLGKIALEIFEGLQTLSRDQQIRVLRASAIICGVETEVKR